MLFSHGFKSVAIAPRAVSLWVTSYRLGTSLLILLVYPFQVEPSTFKNAGKTVVSVSAMLAEDILR